MTTIIFKPLEICNSNCVYCDVIKKENDRLMHDDIFRVLFSRINEYLVSNPHETIDVIWHGGEFSLLGSEYLKRAHEYQERYCRRTSDRVFHLMQSNLTRLSQEIIDSIKLLGVSHVGTSFDPIPNIRGYGKEVDSSGYDRDFFKGVNLLAANGLSWGVIYVVHGKSLSSAVDIMHFLINLNPNNIMFNKVHVDRNDDNTLAITPNQFAQFLGSIFSIWYKYRRVVPSIKTFDEIIECVSKRSDKVTCERSGSCSYKWLYIGPSGEASQCGRCGDNGLIQYGTIEENSICDLLSNSKRDSINIRYTKLANGECKDCRFWGICHGGCPIEAYCENGSFYSRASCCGWVKIFMEQYFEPITGARSELYPVI